MLELFVNVQTFVMERIDALRNREEGQTMAEYAVVIALITLAAVVAFTALGKKIGPAIDKVTAVLP